jgi:hypothetical protein
MKSTKPEASAFVNSYIKITSYHMLEKEKNTLKMPMKEGIKDGD